MVCSTYVKISAMFQHKNVEQPAPIEKTVKHLHNFFGLYGENLPYRFNYFDLKATFCHLSFLNLAAFTFFVMSSLSLLRCQL